jgi:hypothetical protein
MPCILAVFQFVFNFFYISSLGPFTKGCAYNGSSGFLDIFASIKIAISLLILHCYKIYVQKLALNLYFHISSLVVLETVYTIRVCINI